jgi:transcription termination/antitermination protein NusA
MAITEFSAALNQVATERGISPEQVISSIKEAIIAAFRKDNPNVATEDEELTVEMSPEDGSVKVLKGNKDVTPAGFGRIATQTAKQVILQKVRETEKEVIIKEYRSKIGSIVNAVIFRADSGLVIVDLGKTQGIMPPHEQVPNETYRLNQRIKVLIKEIQNTPRGEEVVVSRSDPNFVKELFSIEVPEINSDVVKIESVAREAGSRTKIAVSSSDSHVDPVGSCVGQKGVRVQTIIKELGTEKIDIVTFSADTEKFIAQSLSPATVTKVVLNIDTKTATISVPEDQLSLAIGKEGQNVRLAAKLTGWKIDIKGSGKVVAEDDDDESAKEEKE